MRLGRTTPGTGRNMSALPDDAPGTEIQDERLDRTPIMGETNVVHSYRLDVQSRPTTVSRIQKKR